MTEDYKFGFVTIIGKPNVGKSTLMNRIIGQKISITSHRAQTTRHRILGIHTDEQKQIVFVDTPGIHSVVKKSNRKKLVLNALCDSNIPVVLIINKLDKLKSVNQLLPLIDESSKLYDFTEIVPITALGKAGDEHMLNICYQY